MDFTQALEQHGKLLDLIVSDIERRPSYQHAPLARDDLHQIAKLGLLKAVETHDPTRSPLPNWIRRNVNRAIGDELRKWNTKKRTAEREILGLPPSTLPQPNADFDQLRIEVMDAIKQLPPAQRKLVLERFGFVKPKTLGRKGTVPLKDLASRHNIGTTTLQTRLSEAYDTLRSLLGE